MELYNIYAFIYIFCGGTANANDPKGQSPDYIKEKFERMLGIKVTELKNIDINDKALIKYSDQVRHYTRFWGCSIDDRIINIVLLLYYINNINGFPSPKNIDRFFDKYLTNIANVSEEDNTSGSCHHVLIRHLNEFIDKLEDNSEYNEICRDIKINKILLD